MNWYFFTFAPKCLDIKVFFIESYSISFLDRSLKVDLGPIEAQIRATGAGLGHGETRRVDPWLPQQSPENARDARAVNAKRRFSIQLDRSSRKRVMARPLSRRSPRGQAS